MKQIFYFTADWCNPCKKVKPIVEELSYDGHPTKFQLIDVDTEIELAKKFEIKSIPTFILIQDGEVIKRVSGAQTKDQLLELMNYEKDIEENI